MTGGAGAWGPPIAAVGLASLIPLMCTWWLSSRPALTDRLVPRLIFLAAGALLGAAVFHLIPESLSDGSWPRVSAWVLLGAGALALLERVVHLMERPTAGHTHATLGHASHLMPLGIASDALHNALDGSLVATAFLTDPSLGVFAGLAIAVHELPRELGTFALCVNGGMSPRRAVFVNAATGVLALLGAVLALLIGADAQRLGSFLIPFAAGNFLYLAGAIVVSQRTRFLADGPASNVALMVTGIVLTAVVAGGH